jgi:hypothetical protein
MKANQIARLICLGALAWHVASLVQDAERYRLNLARWRAAPTGSNLLRLLIAEGVLIKDLGWLL